VLQIQSQTLPVAGQMPATKGNMIEGDVGEADEKTFADLMDEGVTEELSLEDLAKAEAEDPAEELVALLEEELPTIIAEAEEVVAKVIMPEHRVPITQNSQDPALDGAEVELVEQLTRTPIGLRDDSAEVASPVDQRDELLRTRWSPRETTFATNLAVSAPLQPSTAIAVQAAFGSTVQSLTKVRVEPELDTASTRNTGIELKKSFTPPTPAIVTPNLAQTAIPVLGQEKSFQSVETLSSTPQELEVVGTQQSSSQSVQASVSATPLRVNAQPVAAQIAAAVFQSNGTTTEIRLSPEELGKVRISMTAGEAGMVVNIFAERQETTDLMRRHIDTLAREFQSLGYEELSFSFDKDGNESQNEGQETNGQTSATTGSTLEEVVQLTVPLGALDLKL